MEMYTWGGRFIYSTPNQRLEMCLLISLTTLPCMCVWRKSVIVKNAERRFRYQILPIHMCHGVFTGKTLAHWEMKSVPLLSHPCSGFDKYGSMEGSKHNFIAFHFPSAYVLASNDHNLMTCPFILKHSCLHLLFGWCLHYSIEDQKP